MIKQALGLLRRPVVIFGLIHAAIFMLAFTALSANYRLSIGGLPGVLELDVATKIFNGKMPYIDFPMGYPPLALVSFLLPALVFRTPLAYRWAFAAEMLLLDFLALMLITAFAKRLKLGVWKTLAIYTILIVALGAILVSRYDLLPAVLVLAALYMFATGRNKLTWALLGLGVAAKLYPIVVAPLLALHLLGQRKYRELAVGAFILLGVLLLVALPWLLRDFSSMRSLVIPQAGRGLHSESVYGSILLAGRLLGLTQLSAGVSALGGSWDLNSPLANQLAAISPYILADLLLVVYVLYARSQWKWENMAQENRLNRDPTLMLNYSSVAILVFLVGYKVLSPQYLVWLCPLLPLVVGRRHHRLGLWLLFAAISGISQYVYPYHYFEFEMGKPYLLVMLLLRNLLLIAMTTLLAFMSASMMEKKHRIDSGKAPLPGAQQPR